MACILSNAFKAASAFFDYYDVDVVVPDKLLFKTYEVEPIIAGSREFHLPEEIVPEYDLSYIVQSMSGFFDSDKVPDSLEPYENKNVTAFIDLFSLRHNVSYRQGHHIFFHNRGYTSLVEVLVKPESLAIKPKYSDYTWKINVVAFSDYFTQRNGVEEYIRRRHIGLLEQRMAKVSLLKDKFPRCSSIDLQLNSLSRERSLAKKFKVPDWKFADFVTYESLMKKYDLEDFVDLFKPSEK